VSWLERFHGEHVHPRRSRILGEQLAPLIPQGARVLDVGCGDGLVAHLITRARPDVRVEGVDVLVRPQTHIPVKPFDGRHLPRGSSRPDVVMFIDVLHHADDPLALLREGAATATRGLLIKDHTLEGILAGPTLRFMDRVSNHKHSVATPYNYWSRRQWIDACDQLGLSINAWVSDVGLYPWPASWVFGRSLHFVGYFALPGSATTA
jgi:SAM-dependent methyltransferase